jgi:hypothetical protein
VLSFRIRGIDMSIEYWVEGDGKGGNARALILDEAAQGGSSGSPSRSFLGLEIHWLLRRARGIIFGHW